MVLGQGQKMVRSDPIGGDKEKLRGLLGLSHEKEEAVIIRDGDT